MTTQIGIVVALALTIAPAIYAQSSNTAYCTELSHQYTKYVADPNAARNPTQAPANVSDAESKCTSDPKAAIPVLEKALTDKKINLPSR